MLRSSRLDLVESFCARSFIAEPNLDFPRSLLCKDMRLKQYLPYKISKISKFVSHRLTLLLQADQMLLRCKVAFCASVLYQFGQW